VTLYRFGTMILSKLRPPDWSYERGRDCHPRQRSPSTIIIHHTTTWTLPPACRRAGGSRSAGAAGRAAAQSPSVSTQRYTTALSRNPLSPCYTQDADSDLSSDPPAPTNHPTRMLTSQDGLCFVRFQNSPPLFRDVSGLAAGSDPSHAIR
jgi:hypothetical protein